MLMRHAARAAAVAAIVGLSLSLAGCAARVKQEDFNNEVAKLREEMQAGDRQVARALDSTNQVVAEHQRRLDALEQQFQAFRSEYQVSIEKVKGMLRFNVPVHFEFDRSELRESDRPVLDRFASVVKETTRGRWSPWRGSPIPPGAGTTIFGWVSSGPRRCATIWPAPGDSRRMGSRP